MKKRLALLFGLLFSFGLFFASTIGSTTAYAAEATVDIKGMSDVKTIKTAVEDKLVTNDKVTVVNSANEPYDSKGNVLMLVIPQEKTLVWKADYTGKVDDTGALLYFAGPAGATSGFIEVLNCSLTATGTGGGLYQGSAFIKLLIHGNTLISSNGLSVSSAGNLEFREGTIASTRGDYAVQCSALFSMTGGVLYSTAGYAVYADKPSSKINISGGFVFGCLTNAVTAGSAHGIEEDKIKYAFSLPSGTPKISKTAIVAVWDTTGGRVGYISGYTDDLTVSPEGSAVWGTKEGASGIRYSGTSFLPLAQVTVTDPMDLASLGEEPATDATTSVLVTLAIFGGFAVLLIAFVVLYQMQLKRRAKVAADAGVASEAAAAEGDKATADGAKSEDESAKKEPNAVDGTDFYREKD